MASLSSINFKIGADLKQFRSSMRNIDRSLSNMSRGFGALGATIGAAFVVDRIAAFGREASEMAGKMEGVENAFKRFADPNLLNDLRKATRGTTNDLELMTAAVKAEQFGIPMEQMATLLEFASRRAQETGQEVDYLVNSIVTGLGRKSPMILDNLGISTTRLKEAFGGAAIEAQSIGDITKVVADIAQEEMGKAGEAFTSTADESAKLGAAMDNLKTAIGQRLNVVLGPLYKLLGGVLERITKLFEKSEEQLKQEQRLAQAQNARVSNQKALNAAVQLGLIETKDALITNGNLTDLQYQVISQNREAILVHLGLAKAVKEETKEKEENNEATKEGTLITETAIPTMVQYTKALHSVTEGLKQGGTIMRQSFIPPVTMTIEEFRHAQYWIQEVGNALNDSFYASLNNGEGFFKTFGQYLVNMVKKLLAVAAAAMLVAAALTIAFGGTAGGFGTAGAMLGLKDAKGFGDLFKGAFAMMSGIPMLASGGIVTGPTLAMIGEGGGPEAVIPLDRLNSFMGAGAVTVTGRIQGQDILLSNERASRIRSRYRGF